MLLLAALSGEHAGRQFIILLMPSSATCAPTVTSAGAGPRIARRKAANASAGIANYRPRPITPHGLAAGDGVSKEKPRSGAGQLTETCPRRLEERRASKLSRMAAVATPVKNVGITLGPEGGAHQSIAQPLIGIAQDGPELRQVIVDRRDSWRRRGWAGP
jgi:hypothetical protein